jgi:plastocyanin
LTTIARILADVSKRPLVLLCLAALVLVSCSNRPVGVISFGSGRQFVPEVADSADNAGLGNAAAIDADGVPYVSSFSFKAELGPDELPVTRPPTIPSIPAVAVDSLSPEGYWQRGAAAMAFDIPLPIPFGPQTDDSLAAAKPTNTNGTDIAVGADGVRHVVWAAQNGVWYAAGDTSFSAENIHPVPGISQAGPLGRPSVAVDRDGKAWVAFTENGDQGQQVLLLSGGGDTGWTTDVVGTIPCSDCPPAGHTGVAIGPTGPVVAYVDPSSGNVVASAKFQGNWQSALLGPGGAGLSMTSGGDGAVYVSYYTDTGVVLATSTDGFDWTTAAVADVTGLKDGQGNTEPTTDVAVQSDGTAWVSWQDAKGVLLAQGRGSFEPVQTRGTEGGAYPSVAVAPDGSQVFVAWYDLDNQDLLVGILGEVGDLAIAAISPTPTPAAGPAPEECGKDKTVQLQEVAKNLAFQNGCLVAPAEKPFTIEFDNQDSGVQHNLTIAKTADDIANPIAATDTITGPDQATLDVDPQPAASYYYECTIHPTTMSGTLAVVKSAT